MTIRLKKENQRFIYHSMRNYKEIQNLNPQFQYLIISGCKIENMVYVIQKLIALNIQYGSRYGKADINSHCYFFLNEN